MRELGRGGILANSGRGLVCVPSTKTIDEVVKPSSVTSDLDARVGRSYKIRQVMSARTTGGGKALVGVQQKGYFVVRDGELVLTRSVTVLPAHPDVP